MKSKALVQHQEQNIIVPHEMGVSSLSSMSRRGLLQRSSALAAAGSMGVGVSLALLSPYAHAGDITVDAKAMISDNNVSIQNGASLSIIRCMIFSTNLSGCFLTVLVSGGVTSAVYRGTLNTTWYNAASYTTPSGVYRRYSLTRQVGVCANSNLTGAVDGGRKLSVIDWGNESGDVIKETGDLSATSDSLILFWEKFVRGTTFYYAATLNYATGVAPAFSSIATFSGTSYTTFANKKQAFINAQTALSAAQGRSRNTTILATCVMGLGVAGTVFSLGAGAAVFGGALVALAGNNLLNGQALIDATGSVATTWTDLASWVESNSGQNLVR